MLTEGATVEYYESGEGYKTYKIKRPGVNLIKLRLN